MNYLLNIKFI